MTDSEIVSACLQRDAAAWSQLHRRYSGLIYACIRRVYPRATQEDVLDVTQNVYVQLWKGGLERYDAHYSFTNYLWVITRRQTINYLKTGEERQRGQFVELTVECAADDPSESYDQSCDYREALKRLAADELELLRLHDVEDLTFEAIGKMWGKDPSTIHRRREKIIKKLKSYAKA